MTGTIQVVVNTDLSHYAIDSKESAAKVNGAIGAQEVIVASSGADYVFDPGYRLAPLKEVADYVREKEQIWNPGREIAGHGADWMRRIGRANRLVVRQLRRGVNFASVGALVLGSMNPVSVWGQWTSCGAGSQCIATAGVGIGTTGIVGVVTMSAGTDRVLNFRGDPVSFGTNQEGTIIQGVNSAQTAYTPITLEASQLYMNAATLGPVGIGTTNPGASLTVNGIIRGYNSTQGYGELNLENSSNGTFTGAQIRMESPTIWAFKSVTSGNNIAIFTDNAITHGVYVKSGGNVGIGTTAPQYPLSVNGTVQAKEVLVNTGWSDYVFGPGYRVAPLNEVSEYIRANGHLPGIPSAEEFAAKGVSLGEMQAKLLAKIEELTLHMIAAENENHELREQNQRLGERITQLERGGVPK